MLNITLCEVPYYYNVFSSHLVPVVNLKKSFSFFFRADREEMRQKARGGEDVEMKDTLIENMESNIELQVPFEPK